MNNSELILNSDGSLFHLHLRPGEVADTVLLVGDPARVQQVAERFDTVEFDRSNREFRTITGTIMGRIGEHSGEHISGHLMRRRITVCSTGIGTDNVDIVVNELDALVNIDFATRAPLAAHKRLTLLRLGTCGAVQPEQKMGDLIITTSSIGMDCLLDFYSESERVRNAKLEWIFNDVFGRRTCCVDSSSEIIGVFNDAGVEIYEGITVSAPGFYAPQGRQLRLKTAIPNFVERLAELDLDGQKIRNIEMESSAVLGLGRLLGHRAGCLCTVVAQRSAGEANPNYHEFVEKMIDIALDVVPKFGTFAEK